MIVVFESAQAVLTKRAPVERGGAGDAVAGNHASPARFLNNLSSVSREWLRRYLSEKL